MDPVSIINFVRLPYGCSVIPSGVARHNAHWLRTALRPRGKNRFLDVDEKGKGHVFFGRAQCLSHRRKVLGLLGVGVGVGGQGSGGASVSYLLCAVLSCECSGRSAKCGMRVWCEMSSAYVLVRVWVSGCLCGCMGAWVRRWDVLHACSCDCDMRGVSECLCACVLVCSLCGGVIVGRALSAGDGVLELLSLLRGKLGKPRIPRQSLQHLRKATVHLLHQICNPLRDALVNELRPKDLPENADDVRQPLVRGPEKVRVRLLDKVAELAVHHDRLRDVSTQRQGFQPLRQRGLRDRSRSLAQLAESRHRVVSGCRVLL